ncbi:MAG TPA: hypothetical protein GX507_11395 [Clostridia bacterium]|nr:hypothetical protein [Clostridia bacterium]
MAALKITKMALNSVLALMSERWDVFVPSPSPAPGGPSGFRLFEPRPMPAPGKPGPSERDSSVNRQTCDEDTLWNGTGQGGQKGRDRENHLPEERLPQFLRRVLTVKPLKELFFPRSEPILGYCVDGAFGGNGDGTGVSVFMPEGVLPGKPRVVFGARPCDAASLTVLDRVFADEAYPDDFYISRRKNTIIVGLGCNVPAPTCFCPATGGDPFGTAGLDVLAYDLPALDGDGSSQGHYLMKAVTREGEALLGFLSEAHLGEGPSESDERACMALEERARKAIAAGLPADTQSLGRVLGGIFNHPYWATLHEKCLGCAACTYLCPTCHCFDISEEPDPGASRSGGESPKGGPERPRLTGVRVRNWDSCMFPIFTLHTSGHNPRPTGLERVRQRVMHKFYYFPENFGAVACVGCGRCVKYCPVNLDIREVISHIAALGGTGVAESISA